MVSVTVFDVLPRLVLKCGSGRYVTTDRARLMDSNVPSIDKNLFPASSGQFPHPTDGPPSSCGEYASPYMTLSKKPQGWSLLFPYAPSLHCASI
eukprot:66458-Rhodomonas_salina.1